MAEIEAFEVGNFALFCCPEPRVRVGRDLRVRLAPHLDVGDPQIVDDGLDAGDVAARRRRQREHAEVRLPLRDRSDDAAVRVLFQRAVGFIDDDEDDARAVEGAVLEVVLHRLGRAVEDAALRPELAPPPLVDGAVDLRRVALGQAHDAVARRDLLADEGPRRRHEDDLALGEPAVVVVHEHRRDERLPEARRQAHERVLQQALLHDALLVRAHGVVRRVEPGRRERRVDARHPARALLRGPVAAAVRLAREGAGRVAVHGALGAVREPERHRGFVAPTHADERRSSFEPLPEESSAPSTR